MPQSPWVHIRAPALRYAVYLTQLERRANSRNWKYVGPVLNREIPFYLRSEMHLNIERPMSNAPGPLLSESDYFRRKRFLNWGRERPNGRGVGPRTPWGGFLSENLSPLKYISPPNGERSWIWGWAGVAGRLNSPQVSFRWAQFWEDGAYSLTQESPPSMSESELLAIPRRISCGA